MCMFFQQKNEIKSKKKNGAIKEKNKQKKGGTTKFFLNLCLLARNYAHDLETHTKRGRFSLTEKVPTWYQM